MNVIGNNCGSSFYYKEKGMEFKNPFVWAAITPDDMIYLIENYDNINFNNYNLVDLDKNLFKTNNLISQKIKDGGNLKGIQIDKKITAYYTHYLDSTIIEQYKDSIDVYCEDNKKYVIDKYVKRLDRMTEKPIFLIITYQHHNWTKSDVEKLSKLKTNKPIILITQYDFDYPNNIYFIKDDLSDLNSKNMINKHFEEINSIIEKYYEATL